MNQDEDRTSDVEDITVVSNYEKKDFQKIARDHGGKKSNSQKRCNKEQHRIIISKKAADVPTIQKRNPRRNSRKIPKHGK